MAGKRLILPGITSFTGPKIRADPILSNGSLLLWDPSHPAGGDAAGVENGAILTNIAADIAAGILGVSASDARPTVRNGAATSPAVPAASIKQRSGKGGLVSIYSKAQSIEEITGTSFLGVNALFLRDYLFEHRHTNSFFVSTWVRSLRSGRQGSGVTSPQPIAYFSRDVSAASSYLYLLQGGNPTGAGTLGGRGVGGSTQQPLWDTDAPRILNVARSGAAGWETGTIAGIVGPSFLFGNADAWGGANEPGPSGIIERCYIEDMTVSGRTYAEIDAIDFALFTTAHAPGGSWHGDTYPNPAGFP